MLLAPFYDPEKTYEENFEKGPFGIFADEESKGGGESGGVASALTAVSARGVLAGNRLTKSNKEVIIRDIEEYFEVYPTAIYKKEWFDLISFLKL